MTHDTSGLSSFGPFAFYDPESSSVRTSRLTLGLGLTESSLTLPKWGWMSAGALYERPTQVPHTSDPVSSSLLPTPVAHDDRKSPEASLAHKQRSGRTQLTSLNVLAKADFKQPMLPTPTSRDGKGRNQRDDDTCLPGAVAKLLPTPTTDDANNLTRESGEYGSLTRSVTLLPTPTTEPQSRRATLPNVADHTAKPGVTLLDAVRLLPTPIARDASQRHREGGKTLRTAIGELTDRPSNDGR
jgi:hypothetical protein